MYILNYERVTNMNYHNCKHSNCAVCSKLEERKIFEFILKRKYPDVYLCGHVAYKITGEDGNHFIIKDISCVLKRTRGYYLINPFTGNEIKLNSNNVEILCESGECNVNEPYVLEWKDKVTQSDQ